MDPGFENVNAISDKSYLGSRGRLESEKSGEEVFGDLASRVNGEQESQGCKHRAADCGGRHFSNHPTWPGRAMPLSLPLEYAQHLSIAGLSVG